MSTSVATKLRSITPVFADHARKSTERVISVSTEIMADRRQLLYALTLPEYLETWITPVDAGWQDEKAVIRSGTAYAIEYCDVYGQRVTIDGVFRTAALDKVVFTWCRRWPIKTRRSLVAIRLSGGFAFTSLSLTHAGFMADAEQHWLRDFWHLSLTQLKSLFELGSSKAFETPSAPFSH